MLANVTALVTLHLDPTLLYRLTREDGLVEWASVIALLLLAGTAANKLLTTSLPRLWRTAGWTLVVLALLAVGEEISWGQRLLGFQTGETMKAINLQNETNFHNLIPGTLFNGLIVFSLGIGFVLIPTIWRKRSLTPPPWLPSPELSVMMLDAILINHYRFASAPEKIGIVVLLALLTQQTLAALSQRQPALCVASLAGWVTVLCHYHSKAVLRAANHQYEIRELLIVIVAAIWVTQSLEALSKKVEKSPSHAQT